MEREAAHARLAAGRALLAAARGRGRARRLRAGHRARRRPAVGPAAHRPGGIGTPLTALTLLQGPGPQSWHPDPEFLFAPGAGPLFDFGPYYLTVLAVLFGPAVRVAAIGRRPRESRVIGSGPRAGDEFAVEVPTYVSALAEYAAGRPPPAVQLGLPAAPRPGFVEITGTEATLAVPDPNRFDGDLRVRRAGDDDWTVIPAAGAAAGRGSA